jgi:hypothetical protein
LRELGFVGLVSLVAGHGQGAKLRLNSTNRITQLVGKIGTYVPILTLDRILLRIPNTPSLIVHEMTVTRAVL